MKYLITSLLWLSLLTTPAVSLAANGNSASFNGTNQNLTINSSLGLTVGGSITIELWFKPSAQPASGSTYTLYTTGMNPYASPFVRYWVGYANVSGTPTLRFNRERTCVSNNFTDYATTLTTGTWYHIVETYDGTNVRGYLGTSGSPDVLVAGPTAQSGNGTNGCPDTYFSAIGSMISSGGVNWAAGKIDEVRIWNSAQSLATIQTNYCTQIDSASGLQASWHLDNALTDSSGNGFTLTNNGTVTFPSDTPACFSPNGFSPWQFFDY